MDKTKQNPLASPDLQNQLQNCIANLEKQAHTIVVVPSLTFDRDAIKDIVGLLHYETRALWETLKLINPNTSIVFISSIPIQRCAVDHLLTLLPDPIECRKRLTLIHLGDGTHSYSLSEKILKRPAIITKIRAAVKTELCYLNTFVATDKENQLATVLGIPLFGKEHHHYHWQTKSGNKKIFTRAQIICADSLFDLKSIDELIAGIKQLWQKYPTLQKFMIKLDDGVSGLGNAILKMPLRFEQFNQYSKEEQNNYLHSWLRSIEFQSQKQNRESFARQIPKGVIVEIFIEGKNKTSPSCQAIINPFGQVEILSTHEQILDESGMTFLGSRFPAKKDHRLALQEATKKIGLELAKEGIIGCFSVDFLASTIGHRKQLHAIEINLRQGGTTHPYHTARLLTQGRFDELSGNLQAGDQFIFYQSNDNFLNEQLIGCDENHFLDFFKQQHVVYNHQLKTGVVFHMLGALTTNGKIGYTAIGTSQSQVTFLNKKILKLLATYSDQFQKKKIAS